MSNFRGYIKLKVRALKNLVMTHPLFILILIYSEVYFTSSNISYTDYQRFTVVWYKNVSSS